jgi:hypothetical protein
LLIPATLAGVAGGLCGHAFAIAFYVTLFQSDRPLAAAQWAINTAFTIVDNPFIAMWIYFVLLFLLPVVICGCAALASGSIIILPLASRLGWSRMNIGTWFALWLIPSSILWTFAILASRSTSLWSDLVGFPWGLLGAVLSGTATLVTLSIKAFSTLKQHTAQ